MSGPRLFIFSYIIYWPYTTQNLTRRRARYVILYCVPWANTGRWQKIAKPFSFEASGGRWEALCACVVGLQDAVRPTIRAGREEHLSGRAGQAGLTQSSCVAVHSTDRTLPRTEGRDGLAGEEHVHRHLDVQGGNLPVISARQ